MLSCWQDIWICESLPVALAFVYQVDKYTSTTASDYFPGAKAYLILSKWNARLMLGYVLCIIEKQKTQCFLFAVTVLLSSYST